ncbi:mitochondrial import inner membrane translocase [Striga asiatica]|uniref:Mitochondrial import inner membrane translocase n=1 Tax=Striga asiatica TaxID=4170 RepID=A0A5A7PY39_STRAF|nr:mitochondrial import inner membrane translocase [Striga asiatica]
MSSYAANPGEDGRVSVKSPKTQGAAEEGMCPRIFGISIGVKRLSCEDLTVLLSGHEDKSEALDHRSNDAITVRGSFGIFAREEETNATLECCLRGSPSGVKGSVSTFISERGTNDLRVKTRRLKWELGLPQDYVKGERNGEGAKGGKTRFLLQDSKGFEMEKKYNKWRSRFKLAFLQHSDIFYVCSKIETRAFVFEGWI